MYLSNTIQLLLFNFILPPIFPSPSPSPEHFHPVGFVREGSFSTDSLDVANSSLFHHIPGLGLCYLHVVDARMMMLWWYTVVEVPMFEARCGLGMQRMRPVSHFTFCVHVSVYGLLTLD